MTKPEIEPPSCGVTLTMVDAPAVTTMLPRLGLQNTPGATPTVDETRLVAYAVRKTTQYGPGARSGIV